MNIVLCCILFQGPGPRSELLPGNLSCWFDTNIPPVLSLSKRKQGPKGKNLPGTSSSLPTTGTKEHCSLHSSYLFQWGLLNILMDWAPQNMPIRKAIQRMLFFRDHALSHVCPKTCFGALREIAVPKMANALSWKKRDRDTCRVCYVLTYVCV